MPSHLSGQDLAAKQASAELRERVTHTAERLSTEVASLLNILSTQEDEAAAVEATMIVKYARDKHKHK